MQEQRRPVRPVMRAGVAHQPGHRSHGHDDGRDHRGAGDGRHRHEDREDQQRRADEPAEQDDQADLGDPQAPAGDLDQLFADLDGPVVHVVAGFHGGEAAGAALRSRPGRSPVRSLVGAPQARAPGWGDWWPDAAPVRMRSNAAAGDAAAASPLTSRESMPTTIARDHCLAPERVDAPIHGGRYRSLFGGLPALRVDEEALHALGRPGGPCDLGDGADGVDSHVDAVWPFFGQFVAHDITADRSALVHRADVNGLRNVRAPRADLEGLYGPGPIGAPYMYRKDDPAKLLLGPGRGDVPRNQEGIALIGDPRNDVQL